MEKRTAELEKPKARAWMQQMELGSFTSAQIATHLTKINPDRRALLDNLMTELFAKAPLIDRKWVKWGNAPGIHVSRPNASKPFVVLAVIPMVRRGIVVKARQQIQEDYVPNTDAQLRFEKVIESSEDFKPIIAQCISVQ